MRVVLSALAPKVAPAVVVAVVVLLSRTSGGTDDRPVDEDMDANSGDSDANASSARDLMPRSGWSRGITASGFRRQSIDDWELDLPRIPHPYR